MDEIDIKNNNLYSTLYKAAFMRQPSQEIHDLAMEYKDACEDFDRTISDCIEYGVAVPTSQRQLVEMNDHARTVRSVAERTALRMGYTWEDVLIALAIDRRVEERRRRR